MNKSKLKISYTANDKYQTSPRSYYLHYMMNLREELIGSALPFGSAIDAAQGTLLMEKDLDKAKETFLKLWESAQVNKKWEKLGKSDKIRWSKSDFDEDILEDEDRELAKNKKVCIEWVSMRKKGLMMLDAYNEQIIPHIKEVFSTQQYVKIENEDGDVIRGYIDLLARWELNEAVARKYEETDKKLVEVLLATKKYNGEIIVFDNKTSSQKYKEDSVQESRQLGTYIENPLLEHEVNYAGYIVIPKKFRKSKLPKIPIQVIIDEVAPEAVEEIFEEYEDTLRGIKLGEFPCTRECTKTPWGCTYQRFCDTNGEDLTGLVFVGKDKNDKKEDKKKKN